MGILPPTSPNYHHSSLFVSTDLIPSDGLHHTLPKLHPKCDLDVDHDFHPDLSSPHPLLPNSAPYCSSSSSCCTLRRRSSRNETSDCDSNDKEEEVSIQLLLLQQNSKLMSEQVKGQTVAGGGAGRRFAILLAGHASEYVRERYGGVASLFKRLLGEAGETWDTFSVIDGQFPTSEFDEDHPELDKYDGFIITGSRHDAHSDEPWVLRLCALIQRVHKKKKKLLGICFGHQVISRALGGRSGRAANGWECGLKKIEVCREAMRSKRWWRRGGRKLPIPPPPPPLQLSIIEVHQDEVWEVPPGGQILGWSDNTKVEIMALGNEVLGIQGHPEFTHDIALDILTSSRYAALLPTQVIDQAMLSFKQGHADQQFFQQLCKAFLKEKPPIQKGCTPTQLLEDANDGSAAINNVVVKGAS